MKKEELIAELRDLFRDFQQALYEHNQKKEIFEDDQEETMENFIKWIQWTPPPTQGT